MTFTCLLGIHDSYTPKGKDQVQFNIREEAPGWMQYCTKCGKGKLYNATFWSYPNEEYATKAKKLKYG